MHPNYKGWGLGTQHKAASTEHWPGHPAAPTTKHFAPGTFI
jgi:hypothetical protein